MKLDLNKKFPATEEKEKKQAKMKRKKARNLIPFFI